MHEHGSVVYCTEVERFRTRFNVHCNSSVIFIYCLVVEYQTRNCQVYRYFSVCPLIRSTSKMQTTLSKLLTSLAID